MYVYIEPKMKCCFCDYVVTVIDNFMIPGFLTCFYMFQQRYLIKGKYLAADAMLGLIPTSWQSTGYFATMCVTGISLLLRSRGL